MAVRTLTAVAATLVIAWLGVQLRDQDIIDGVSPALIGDPNLPRARFEHDLERLADARFLNPDPTWRMNRAIALLPRDTARAQAEAERIVRDEPENATGWRILAATVRNRDPQRWRQAWRQVLRLDPLATR